MISADINVAVKEISDGTDNLQNTPTKPSPRSIKINSAPATPGPISQHQIKEFAKPTKDVTMSAKLAQKTVLIVQDFFATMHNQLSVFVGDTVELLNDSDKFWWFVREIKSGQTGYIPCEIVQTGCVNQVDTSTKRKPLFESTDFLKTTPTRTDALDSYKLTNEVVQSGFVKRTGFHHAAKKSVSFAKDSPTKHIFDVESSCSDLASGEEEGEDSRIENSPTNSREFKSCSNHDSNDNTTTSDRKAIRGEEIPLALNLESKVFFNEIDTLVETFLKDDEKADMDTYLSTKENTLESRHEKIKPPFIKRLFGKSNKFNLEADLHYNTNNYSSDPIQMVRIYGGNFIESHCYKTCMVHESTTIAEMAIQAVKKFNLENDGFDYVLSIAHFKSFEMLPIHSSHTLANAIELAKLVTLREKDLTNDAKLSIATLPVTIRKQLLATISIKNRKKDVQKFHVDDGFFSSEAISTLPRNPASDFITHYKFILNRCIDGPLNSIPFYLTVKVYWGGRKRDNSDGEDSKRLKVLTDMTIGELGELAIRMITFGLVPGIKYRYSLLDPTITAGCKDNPNVESFMLPLTDTEQKLGAMLSWRPLLDLSSTVIVMQPHASFDK